MATKSADASSRPNIQSQVEKDNELVRTVFDKDQRLLKAMRAIMLGLKPSADDKALVASAFQSDELFRIVSGKFYPTLNPDAPIGQLQEVWLGVEEMIYGASRDQIYQAVKYKDIALEFTKRGLKLLRNPDDPNVPDIDLSYDVVPANGKIDEELQTWLLGRNMYIKHVETQLRFLDVLVNLPDAQVSSTGEDQSK